MPNNIILIGFSYTGKSVAGKALAVKLGWEYVDTDALIVEAVDKSIERVFTEDGERRFRDLEREALKNACARQDAVISTGGGVVIVPTNRSLIVKSGFVVCLEAFPATIYKRLQENSDDGDSEPVRPLIEGGDFQENIKLLKERRQPLYAIAEWTVHTDKLTIDQVAGEIMRGHRLTTLGSADIQEPPASPFRDADYTVFCGSRPYPGYVGWGILDDLGPRMRDLGISGTVHVIADTPVFALYGQRVIASLEEAGFDVGHHLVPPGESTKTLAAAETIYEWLTQRKAERDDTVVCLGGGMAGDLAGFVAATYLRGLSFVQTPTTLLAMVDASIGGKTAVNLKAGKNLVGAFHQPRLVLADVATLKTLPPRQRTAGWAEVVKHALILDHVLFAHIEANRDALRSLDAEVSTDVIKQSANIKAHVVSADERETLGPRMLLNYGHTVGHALEAALGYDSIVHGEAVAIGMMAAADISYRMGMLSAEGLQRQRELLTSFGLPTKAPPVDPNAVREAMALDKKVAGRVNRWVLLRDIGEATVRDDVPDVIVDAVLKEVLPG